MSDFFLRLAARALNQTDVVEPRIPSRFAAAPVDSGFEEQTFESVASTITAAPDDPSSDAARSQAATEQPRHGDRTVVTRTDSAPARPTAPPSQGEMDSLRARTPARAEPRELPPAISLLVMKSHDVRAVDMPPPSAATATAPSAQRPEAGERRRGLFADAAIDGAARADPAAVLHSDQTDGISVWHLSESPRKQGLDDAPAWSAPVVSPQVHDPGRADERSQPKVQPEPVIEVHIGRIEIHAAPPSLQPALQESAAPAMSLSDYLRSRNGGGRQ